MAIEFEDPIVAGTVLIRELIRSQDYVPGVSGWVIYASGDAEFNDVTIRGTVIITGSNDIEFPSGHVSETEPATIDPDSQALWAGLRLLSPEMNDSGVRASLHLIEFTNGDTQLTGVADVIEWFNTSYVVASANGAADGLAITPLNDGKSLQITGGVISRTSEGWTNVLAAGAGDGRFQNAWVNFGGTSPVAAYRLYPDGDVGIRGLVKNGTATTIFTLPAGYRPPVGVGFAAPISPNGATGRLIVNASGAVAINPLSAGAQTFTELTCRFSTLS